MRGRPGSRCPPPAGSGCPERSPPGPPTPLPHCSAAVGSPRSARRDPRCRRTPRAQPLPPVPVRLGGDRAVPLFPPLSLPPPTPRSAGAAAAGSASGASHAAPQPGPLLFLGTARVGGAQSGAARRSERARRGRGTPEHPPGLRSPPEPSVHAHGVRVAAGRGCSPRRAMAVPRTLGELQLYRVLQRANLLGYYETFIQQGGDDVQQLCEAGEEEFLEIMALVGMATKPLHVRRLQKALREWASNPGLFSQPVPAVPVSSIPLFKLSDGSGRKSLSNGHASPGEAAGKGGGSAGTPPARSPTEPPEKLSPSGVPPWPGRSTPESEGGGDEEPGAPPFSPGGAEQPSGGDALEPELVRTVAESVERLLQSCPRGGDAELRALLKLNKKLAKAVGHIFQLEDGDRQKEEEIRRHSAIYGRGDARRREGKQLTLHELIINEAAAQFCLRDNSLLLRRVELFSLSRQVARESTYLSSLKVSRAQPEDGGASAAKRLKQEVGEQSRPDPPPLGSDLHAPPYRVGNEEDAGGAAGESPDGHAQAAGLCPRLTPPPGAAPDAPLALPPHGLWSRHILQQTLMDEGLRLARLVSHERVGRLSPCLPGKPPEFEDGLAERGPPAPPDPPRGTIKVEQENSRQ